TSSSRHTSATVLPSPRRRSACTKKVICFAKLPNYLFRSVALSLSTHRMVLSPRKYGVYGLTYHLDLKKGGQATCLVSLPRVSTREITRAKPQVKNKGSHNNACPYITGLL